MASEIFEMPSIESFVPNYPIPATDFSEISYGNISTDLNKEKILDGIFDECIRTTYDNAHSVQTSESDIQEFLKEFLLISPDDSQTQNTLNTLDDSEENLSRNVEYQFVTSSMENNESPHFIDLSPTTSISPEAVTTLVILPRPPTDTNNSTPLTSRQKRYRSLTPQVCDACGKILRTRQHLQRHRLEKHTDDMSPNKFAYPCQQCDKRFKRREHLQLHQRTKHSSIKDHKCETCGKEFVRKGQLTRHMMYHERTKTASICTRCGRVFARRGNLVNHVANGCFGTRIPGAW